MRHIACMLSACSLLLFTSCAQAADTKATGVIKLYECGDNCYLTIETKQRKEIIGICAAKACDPWNENAEMPATLIGKKVAVTISIGKQYDGAGNVMGMFPSFKKIVFLKK